ncbi:DUF7660 family protein [Mucilaginibacter myungsuensis]|uniref:DUF7660 domain-containing protein n=1 Tax=Mucilaginibacter myungsuensis TaxID=649104 RepID=A0A929PVK4_9SPHI|nr:hypothetical protein [Mucilaginibacter myungsuensis]MBE9661878.1 hypothetical protein [Mucilaginibacter myungsuensis]MDN3599688.1 hypothetical protein [Mucilaginibacter myungsuensis]
MRNLETVAQNVGSKQDFINFVQALIEDLKTNSNNWTNVTLEGYLEGMKSWTEDMDGYYLNNGLPAPSRVAWQIIADILMGAKIYE